MSIRLRSRAGHTPSSRNPSAAAADGHSSSGGAASGGSGRLPPLPPLSPPVTPASAMNASLTAPPTPAAADGSSLSWIPSRLPFRCSSVILRGGPLLQGTELQCQRLQLDLAKGTLSLHLKWPEPSELAHQQPTHHSAAAAAAHSAASPAAAASSSSSANCSFSSPVNSASFAAAAASASAAAAAAASTAATKKRSRVEEIEEEEGDGADEDDEDSDGADPSTAAAAYVASPVVDFSAASGAFSSPSTASTNATNPFALTVPSPHVTFAPTMPEQVPVTKRGRTDERSSSSGVASSFFGAASPSPRSPFHSPHVGAHAAHFASPHSTISGSTPGSRSIWSIPMSQVVGVDFAISLDHPATCTLALKPHSVYTADQIVKHASGTAAAGANGAGPESFTSPRTRHARHLSGSTVNLADLPLLSPARLLVSSYQQAAAKNPRRFTRVDKAIRRYLPPLLFWIWLHSTYTACLFLGIGCVASFFRFWLTAFTCFFVYLALLGTEFRRNQSEYLDRLHASKAPDQEVFYVHLVFANREHDAYTSFLSFRRLFVAAAPAFSAPSASSSGAAALIPASLPLPSALLWSPPRSHVPQRYPISHLQHVLPVAPLFFGSIWADFVFYLILPPTLFASARVRSVTHFLLPVLYLGQASVAAFRALSPVAVQGCLLLAPYVHLELLWFVSLLDSFPNPLSWLHWVLPLDWIRSAVARLLLDVWAPMVWRAWSSVTAGLFVLSAPVRWINAMLSPVLEVIRQEARALWGFSMIFQPLLTLLVRVQSEMVRAWSSISALLAPLFSLFGSLLPSRLMSLFGAMKSSASATASIGSGISASGGLSRWRSLYLSVQEFAGLISKSKAVVDRARHNIQLWTERILHSKEARNLAAHASNPNLDVPVVMQGLERTQSELSAEEQALLEAAGGDAIASGSVVGLGLDTNDTNGRDDDLMLTPRRPLTPQHYIATAASADGGVSSTASTPLLAVPKDSRNHPPPQQSSQPSSSHMPANVSLNSSTAALTTPPPAAAVTDLPSPPVFDLSPIQAEPPSLMRDTASSASGLSVSTASPTSSATSSPLASSSFSLLRSSAPPVALFSGFEPLAPDFSHSASTPLVFEAPDSATAKGLWDTEAMKAALQDVEQMQQQSEQLQEERKQASQ